LDEENVVADRVQEADLLVEKVLYDFINTEALPGTGVDPVKFWAGFDALIHDFSPQIRTLLKKRAALQSKLDAWHLERTGQELDTASYKAYLTEIEYLVPEGALRPSAQ
jgi:malate synthase